MNLEEKCSEIMSELMPALEDAEFSTEEGILKIHAKNVGTIAIQLAALRKVWLALKALAEASGG